MGIRNRAYETSDRVIHTKLYGVKAEKILSYIFRAAESTQFNRMNWLSQGKYGRHILDGMSSLYVFRANDGEVCLCSNADPYRYARINVGKSQTAEKRLESVVKFIAGACKLDVCKDTNYRSWKLLDAQVTAVEDWNAANETPAFQRLAEVYTKPTYCSSAAVIQPPTFTVGDVYKLCKALKSSDKFKKQYEADVDDFIGQADDPMTVELRVSALDERGRLVEERDKKVSELKQSYRKRIDELDRARRRDIEQCMTDCVNAVTKLAEELGVDKNELLSDLPSVRSMF